MEERKQFFIFLHCSIFDAARDQLSVFLIFRPFHQSTACSGRMVSNGVTEVYSIAWHFTARC
jgi:hypothetical protein